MRGQIGRIVYLIIVLVVVVVSLIFYPKIISFSKTIIDKLTGKESEIMEKAKPNLDLMLDKFDLCDNVDDYNCFCEVFPNFPATLPKEIGLQFKDTQDGTNLTAFFSSEKNVLDWLRLKSKYKLLSVEVGMIDWFNKDNKKIIRFNMHKGYPLTKARHPLDIKREEFVVLSPFLLKTRQISYVIGNYKKRVIGTSGTGLTNIYEEINPEDESRKINQKIQEMPKCINGRIKTMDFFKSLVEKLKRNNAVRNIAVDIGEGFYIEVKDKNENGKVRGEIKLLHNGKIIKKINERLDENFKKEIRKWKIKRMNETISKDLVCDGNYLRLEKGDKINIEIVDAEACIKKLG